MENQKIKNILDATFDKVPKFTTKNQLKFMISLKANMILTSKHNMKHQYGN